MSVMMAITYWIEPCEGLMPSCSIEMWSSRSLGNRAKRFLVHHSYTFAFTRLNSRQVPELMFAGEIG